MVRGRSQRVDHLQIRTQRDGLMMAPKVVRTDGRHPKTIGARLDQLTSVIGWYREGFFTNDDELRGALKLAYQQAQDGMGDSVPGWMGLTRYEFNEWFPYGTLPGKRARHSPPKLRNDDAPDATEATSDTNQPPDQGRDR
jgi:hypothetical protein